MAPDMTDMTPDLREGWGKINASNDGFLSHVPKYIIRLHVTAKEARTANILHRSGNIFIRTEGAK